jgi:hypothetical protein
MPVSGPGQVYPHCGRWLEFNAAVGAALADRFVPTVKSATFTTIGDTTEQAAAALRGWTDMEIDGARPFSGISLGLPGTFNSCLAGSFL